MISTAVSAFGAQTTHHSSLHYSNEQVLDIDELGGLMKETGVPFQTEGEIAEAIQALDINGDGIISLGEYMTYWLKRRKFMKEEQHALLDDEVVGDIKDVGMQFAGFQSAMLTIAGRVIDPSEEVLAFWRNEASKAQEEGKVFRKSLDEMHNEYALSTVLEKIIAPTIQAISLSNRIGAHTEYGQLLLNNHVLDLLVDIEHNIKKIYTFYCNDETEQDGHISLTWEDVVIQNRKMYFTQFVS